MNLLSNPPCWYCRKPKKSEIFKRHFGVIIFKLIFFVQAFSKYYKHCLHVLAIENKDCSQVLNLFYWHAWSKIIQEQTWLRNWLRNQFPHISCFRLSTLHIAGNFQFIRPQISLKLSGMISYLSTYHFCSIWAPSSPKIKTSPYTDHNNPWKTWKCRYTVL